MAIWGDQYPVGPGRFGQPRLAVIPGVSPSPIGDKGIDWRSLFEIVLTFALLTLWAALWLR